MDNETKDILKILGVAVVVLFLLKPKKGKRNKIKDSTSEPNVDKTEAVSEKEFENAIISIKAYRSALNNNESVAELDKLNRILLKENGIKVFLSPKSGKLTARNSKGQDVANEE
jgi:hypothetical protein